MRRVMIVRPGSSLGPAMVGLPVTRLAPDLIEAHATRYRAAPADLAPARLWLAKGRTWRGPFRGWREALAALGDLAPALDLPNVAKALQPGRGTPQGAATMAGGWRYRLAWSGDDPPRRYG